MKFNFRKIVSAGASALLGLSTVALAAAANYPAPFVQSGKADVAIVVGQSAATSDTSAATALSADLGTAFVSQGGSSSSVTTTTTGEAFPLFTSSSELYLNDSINNVRSTITDDELPTVLADGTFSGAVGTSSTTTDYTQKIVLSGYGAILFGQEPTSDDDPQAYIRLGTSSANAVYNSTIVFNKAINLTDSDSWGETLELFGEEWSVGSDTTTTDIVLYKSSEKFQLTLGGSTPNPTKTVDVDGQAYTIELTSGSDTSATIKVTNSAGVSQSKEIDEDTSKKVNGVEVAVSSADESEALGTVVAQITVGSNKIILTDGQNVQYGADEDNIEGTTAAFTGTTGALTALTIQTYADDSDSDAIVAGGSFLDPVWGSFKIDFSGLSTPLDSTDRDMIKVDNSGDDRARVTFTNHRDVEKSFIFMDNESQSMRLAYGNDATELIKVAEQAALNRSMYVVVGNEDEGYLLELKTVTNSTSGNGYSDDKVTFRDVFESKDYDAVITADGVGTVTVGGKTYDVTYSGASTNSDAITVRLNYPDSTGNGVIVFPTIEASKGARIGLYEPTTIALNNFDGASGNVTSFSIPDGDGYSSVTVGRNITTNSGVWNFTFSGGSLGQVNTTTSTQSKSGSVGPLTYNVSAFGTTGSVKLYLVDPVNGGNIVNPAIVIFEEEEDRSNNYSAMIVTLEGAGTSNDGDGVNTVLSTNALSSSYTTLESNDDLSQLLTYYGSLITLDNGESDQKVATIAYPDDQVQAMVYVAEGSAVTGSSGGGALGNIVVKDSEVSSVSSKNLIVVGGSCINTVAAKLLGSSSPLCGADFTSKTGVGAGSYVIQSFSSPYSSSKVALLVAGYNAEDTTNAANALKSNTVDTMAGKKYTGSTATSVTPVLG